MGIYTDEQLKRITENLNQISLIGLNVLKVIADENGINHVDIHQKAGLSKFVADKCLAACLVSGLVTRFDDGVKKIYRLTEDGKRALELSNVEGVQ